NGQDVDDRYINGITAEMKMALAVNVATAIQATVIGSVCSVLKKVTFNSAGSFFKEPFFKIIIFTSVLG
ncbi:hypothetical protein DXB45_11985, partial [Clostridium sp. OM04-12AA]